MLIRTLILACSLALTSSAHAEPAPDGPTLPEDDANPGATRAQAIDAFVKDCHATLMASAFVYEEEQKVAECNALNVDQNCNPDTFGCFGDLDACQQACQPVCGNCQNSCATTCDDCKGSCPAGDSACIRKCAEGRADCRGRCMNGLRQCQGQTCSRASGECMSVAVKRLRGCDASKCDDYIACYDEQEDYELAPKVCKPKARGMDDFCQRVCDMHHGFPEYLLEDDDSEPALIEDGKGLAKLCTAEAQCPADYAQIAPYLASFCAGTTSDASLVVLAGEVTRKVVSKRTLGIVFNAYGAMHGYEFKKEKWLNGLFYGSGAAWLPASCRAKMKTVASAKAMPFHLTKLRDRVKKIWNEAR